ncbi:MAG TPA: hypothetical protein VF838_10980 [Trebonia sp.]
MTDPRTATAELQAQTIDWIRKSQDAVVDALRTWAGAVHSVTPSLPVSAAPFADQLPRPSDLVGDAFDFAAQLLAAQRKFAEDVIQVTAPVADEAPAAAK